MTFSANDGGTILRLFTVRVKEGRSDELLAKFATTSADVVQHEPGNAGYFYGKGIAKDEDTVIFASLWQNIGAVQDRFGTSWQESFLPPGYDELIDTCTICHIDVGTGWNIKAFLDQ